MSPLIKSDAKVALLGSIPLFARCNRKELGRIAAITSAVDLPQGDVMCEQGRYGSEFFVIIEGGATITVQGQVKAAIGPGDFCGEMALLDGGPRVASVTTDSPSRVLVLTRQEFDGLLRVNPGIGRHLLAAMAERLRAADEAGTPERDRAPIGA